MGVVIVGGWVHVAFVADAGADATLLSKVLEAGLCAVAWEARGDRFLTAGDGGWARHQRVRLRVGDV